MRFRKETPIVVELHMTVSSRLQRALAVLGMVFFLLVLLDIARMVFP